MMLLETIKQLSQKRPLGRDAVEELLDVALRGDPNNTNRYLEVMRSFRNAPGIREVELRLPLEGATRKDGLLIVELDPGAAAAEPITGEQVRAQFGPRPELLEPEPEQPESAPHYLIYAQPWGALRFGFARPSWDTLTTVVIDVER